MNMDCCSLPGLLLSEEQWRGGCLVVSTHMGHVQTITATATINQYQLCTQYVPGTILNSLHMLT